jgi:hypothetical protein
MFISHLDLEICARERVADLLREAEQDRRVNLALRGRLPVRARVARRLYAFAEWIEGRPSRSVIRASAQ